MPFAAIQSYLNALPSVQAELKAVMSEVAVYPHLKPDDARSLARRWEHEANASTNGSDTARGSRSERRVAPPALLKLAGIGMRIKPAKRGPAQADDEKQTAMKAPADHSSHRTG